MDELLQQIQELRNRIVLLEEFNRSLLSAAEVPPEIRRMIQTVVGAVKLSDLADVSGTDTATTGQVLKKTAGDWQPGTDNI